MDVILEADKSGGIEFGTALPVPRTKKPRHREVTTFGIGLLYPRNPRPYIYNTLSSAFPSRSFHRRLETPHKPRASQRIFFFSRTKAPSSPPLLVRRRGLESSTGVETKLLRSWYGIIHTVEISRHVSVSRISSPLYVCIYIYICTHILYSAENEPNRSRWSFTVEIWDDGVNTRRKVCRSCWSRWAQRGKRFALYGISIIHGKPWYVYDTRIFDIWNHPIRNFFRHRINRSWKNSRELELKEN